VDIEDGRAREAGVAAQSRSLLSQAVGEGNVPTYRVHFRNHKFSSIQGNASTASCIEFPESSPQFWKATSAMIVTSTWMMTHGPVWMIWVAIVHLIVSMFLITFVDKIIALAIDRLYEHFFKKETHFAACDRDWITFKTMVLIMVYYIFCTVTRARESRSGWIGLDETWHPIDSNPGVTPNGVGSRTCWLGDGGRWLPNRGL
jgi:hypothetical protein